MGALDLAAKRWPDLVPALQGNVASPSAGVKQATLEALGYVCEDLDPSALEQAQVNVVLTAVVAGMRKEEEPATREVATKALDNALVFAKKNFEADGERNYLMQMLCEGAQAPELQVRSPPGCLQLPAVSHALSLMLFRFARPAWSAWQTLRTFTTSSSPLT